MSDGRRPPQVQPIPATIRDVVRAAGVSIGTLSKVLNKTGAIAPATRERVAGVGRALQFRPNALAQSLHSSLSGSIGLISNDSFGRFSMPIMEGLEALLAPLGIGVFMSSATDDPAREAAHIDQMMAKQIDGLVITARRSDHRRGVRLGGLGVPVIYVFSHSDDADALTLLPDDEVGARLAVDHLVALGRRRIAHVTGPAHFEAVQLRRTGYLAALAAAGLVPLPCLHGKWSESWGREAVAQRYTGAGPGPDVTIRVDPDGAGPFHAGAANSGLGQGRDSHGERRGSGYGGGGTRLSEDQPDMGRRRPGVVGAADGGSAGLCPSRCASGYRVGGTAARAVDLLP